jgi:multimeric flavodoxin WrbA
MNQADGVIFGTPVWYFGISSKLKTFIDRWEPTNAYSATDARKLFNPYQVVGAIAVGYNRNGGQEQAILEIIKVALGFDRICVGSAETLGARGAVVLWPERSAKFLNPNWAEIAKKDELGLKSVKGVGRRVAEVARIMKAGSIALKQV